MFLSYLLRSVPLVVNYYNRIILPKRDTLENRKENQRTKSCSYSKFWEGLNGSEKQQFEKESQKRKKERKGNN